MRISSSSGTRGGGFVAVAAACHAMSTAPDSRGYDFDGDGKSDLRAPLLRGADAHADRPPGWARGPAGLRVGRERRGAYAVTVLGDFNGDGKTDLAADGPSVARVTLLDGTTAIAQGWFGNGGAALALVHAGDFDGDSWTRLDRMDGTLHYELLP